MNAPCGQCGHLESHPPYCGGDTAAIKRLLDCCVTAFGSRLSPDARGSITAAITAPSAQTWDAAHATIIHRRGRTLLEAVAAIARHIEPLPPAAAPASVRWPHVPGPALIMLALEENARPQFRA